MTAGRDRSIAEVCSETGLSARTLRYYEELGLLPGVRRRSGGRRVYGDDEMTRLGFIARLKTLGLTLSEIAELNDIYALAGSTEQMLARLVTLLELRLEHLDARIAELGRLRGEMVEYRDRVRSRIEASRSPARAAKSSKGRSR